MAGGKKTEIISDRNHLPCNPVSTYRIQFSHSFTFRDLGLALPYLNELGVKTIYASPVFRAVNGSSHGYDVTNPLVINPEIGSLEDLRKIAANLKYLGMNWIQDIVPNHMAYSVDNPWIYDILEKGKNSQFSEYFDIDWEYPDKALRGKLIFPFLDKPHEALIREGNIRVIYDTGSFFLKINNFRLPINSDSLQFISESSRTILNGEGKETPFYGKNDIMTILVSPGEKSPSDQKAINYLNGILEKLNTDSERLNRLVRMQFYVPVKWNETLTRLNYRRFFTINGLICLRMEDRKVFDHYHSLVGSLCRENLFQGLRIDHIDGLSNPGEYLNRIRELAGRDKYIVVEKILGRDESIESGWPVSGDTGYHFLALCDRLLSWDKGLEKLKEDYDLWADAPQGPVTLEVHRKKQLILYNHMAGDLQNLLIYFCRLGLPGLESYDLAKIRSAIGEFLLSCPVYRLYPHPCFPGPGQKKILARMFREAIAREPHLSAELHLLKKLILRPGDTPGKKKEIISFFNRCMQFSGALMAKGVEDTLFYTFNMFIAQNEVGDHPGEKGITAASFHRRMSELRRSSPAGMRTTSTHDTKRGEDTRARLTALSSLAELWKLKTTFWKNENRRFKTRQGDREIPSSNEEYFIYQAIAGSLNSGNPEKDYLERFTGFIIKALREGKVNTNWDHPDDKYEEGCIRFINSILAPGSSFLKSLSPFIEKVIILGAINSLVMSILKFSVPGIPDNYQGSENLNYSFSDPDNRRPVDFTLLKGQLDKVRRPEFKPAFPVDVSGFADIKIFIISRLYGMRNCHKDLFEKGEYTPLTVRGTLRGNIFAFARRHLNSVLIFVLPMHTGIFFDNEKDYDFNRIDWDNTGILIPVDFPAEYNSLLTGQSFISKGVLHVKELFSELPVCIISGERQESARKAGVLMHITSLPGNCPAGNFGNEAYEFANLLRQAGQSYWQVLPLNKVSQESGYSPYSPLSAFAGNTLLISPEKLDEQNLLCRKYANSSYSLLSKSDFKASDSLTEEIISDAFQNFTGQPPSLLKKEFHDFVSSGRHWLVDFSLFLTIRNRFDNIPWCDWPKELRTRDPKAIARFSEKYAYDIEKEKFAQFIFHRQWLALKNYCNGLGIKIFGDIPFYVGFDSADVWAHPELFRLDRKGKMLATGGVPPDYFSMDGQLWEMPVYRWDNMKKEKFSWWKKRIAKNLELFDIVRLDHFRGFSAYWEIPAGEETAIRGKWTTGPGAEFFEAMRKEFHGLPFVAEDLGQIDSDVNKLRDRFSLPGMKVIQFAFTGEEGESTHLPFYHTMNSVVYTGTHDNNTSRGWFENETDRLQLKNLKKYTGSLIDKKNCHLHIIRLAYSSVAGLAMVPVQDFLGLESSGRMNDPSTASGNWVWRLTRGQFTPVMADKIKKMCKIFGRL